MARRRVPAPKRFPLSGSNRVRKISSNAFSNIGRPGYKTSFIQGGKVGKTVGGQVLRVKRLFARDPTKANSLIGTNKDINFESNVNQVGAQNPRILRGAPTEAEVPGVSHVVDRSANRRIKATGGRTRRRAR